MIKGDILKGKKRGPSAAKHYIIFLRDNDTSSFIGTVLTHGSNNSYQDNVLMEKQHFKKIDDSGKKYDFSYDNTYLVKKQFIKPEDWGPFTKVGELTKKGVAFIDQQINNEIPIFWDSYVKQ